MPNYPWLLSTRLDVSDVAGRLQALRKVGVPYSLSQAEYDANVAKFGETVARQLHIPDAQKKLIEQANFGNFDGDRSGISEMDALVAYLQVLGTMVDFSKYTDDAFVDNR
jgi:cytochrome c oxidase cbb3-type subunit 2